MIELARAVQVRCLEQRGVGEIAVPVLVLAGGQDRVDPPAVLTDHLLRGSPPPP
jgi:pimeloyl-ACP methyl ester carboxylesterase